MTGRSSLIDTPLEPAAPTRASTPHDASPRA
jgi:hypothetical protein